MKPKKVGFSIDGYAVAVSDGKGKRVAVLLEYARQSATLVVAAVQEDRGYDAWPTFEKLGWQIVPVTITGAVEPRQDTRWIVTRSKRRVKRKSRPKLRRRLKIRAK